MAKRQYSSILAAVVVVWTFVVTICRAIRMPNDYSEAHWLLDYRFGFMRRGLIGSICSVITDALGIQMTPSIIVVLSVITLCAMSAAMLYLLIRPLFGRQTRMNVLVLGIVFASSPFLVMSAHLLGYFDALMYFLAIASVALVLGERPLLAAILSSLAILIHEAYLLIGLPLVCLASVAVLTAKADHGAHWTRYLIAACIPIVVFAALLLQSATTDAVTLGAQLTERLDSFGFVPTRSAYVGAWQTTTFRTYFDQQVRLFDERLLNPLALISIGPPLLTILAFIHSSFRIRPFSAFSTMLLGAVCAPLAMHAVAWDTCRISTYPIAGALIAWWILSQTRKPLPTDGLVLLVALPTMILNIFGHIPLMDGQVERFTDPWRLLLYLPAIISFAAIVRSEMRGSWFKEFHQDSIPKAAGDDQP